MANEKQLIRVLTEPTIVLDDIQAVDVEQGTSEAMGNPTSPVAYSKQYGGVFPTIQVNKKVFPAEDIAYLKMSCSGDIPTITVTINLRDKSFYSLSFPKDGDRLSIFIRSKDDLFKPIRNDYEITSVRVDPRPGGGENTPEDVTISGELMIPTYKAIKCFSKNNTSMQAILQTATDLNLGFASNEVDTADKQSWICPFETTQDFIYNTTLAAWKDEQSFFTYFIDHYYYLNFVNVEPLFSEKSEIDEAMGFELVSQDFGKDSSLAKFKGKVVLSNWDDVSGTPFFIQSYALANNAASVNLRNGYKRYVQYYDPLLKESETVFVDPKTTPDSEKEKVLLKGRAGEDFYLRQINGKWMGVQYGENSENCHEKFNYARITNFQNMVHLDKMSLRVSLEGMNMNIRRMQSIPVVIVIKKDYTRKRMNEPEDQDQQSSEPNSNEPNRPKSALSFEDTPFTLDKTISGFYVVNEITYLYEQGRFTQDCILIRREWPTPPQVY